MGLKGLKSQQRFQFGGSRLDTFLKIIALQVFSFNQNIAINNRDSLFGMKYHTQQTNFYQGYPRTKNGHLWLYFQKYVFGKNTSCPFSLTAAFYCTDEICVIHSFVVFFKSFKPRLNVIELYLRVNKITIHILCTIK